MDFLKTLIETPSPSGFEHSLQGLVKKEAASFADRVYADVNGNVIMEKNPKGSPRVMLAGHADEIGFMVKYITDEGFIYFAAIGGVDAGLVPGQRVEIQGKKGKVFGVVGKNPIHLIHRDGQKKKPEIHDLWIDIGAKNKKDVEKEITIGDSITFVTRFERLKNGLYCAHSFDDKVGVFVVVEVMRRLSKEKLSSALFGVSTVQEEIGLRGARTSAYHLKPDVGIAIDVDFASDYPDINKKMVGEIKLGGGPVLSRGANINPVVGKMLIETAKKKKIPYQISGSPRATGTDANVMQLSRGGVAAGLIGIPNRYMHTPVEVVASSDIENAIRLLVSFVKQLRPGAEFTI